MAATSGRVFFTLNGSNSSCSGSAVTSANRSTVLTELDGARLTDVVGGQGVAFNQDRGQDMYAFGWAATAPYDGNTMSYCSGTTFDATTVTTGIGMDCDLTGGASGGPWLQRFDENEGVGVISSVNSYKLNFVPHYVFGPYFGDTAQNLYETAQTA